MFSKRFASASTSCFACLRKAFSVMPTNCTFSFFRFVINYEGEKKVYIQQHWDFFSTAHNVSILRLVCAAPFCQCNLDVDYELPVVHLITIDWNNAIEWESQKRIALFFFASLLFIHTWNNAGKMGKRGAYNFFSLYLVQLLWASTKWSCIYGVEHKFRFFPIQFSHFHTIHSPFSYHHNASCSHRPLPLTMSFISVRFSRGEHPIPQ